MFDQLDLRKRCEGQSGPIVIVIYLPTKHQRALGTRSKVTVRSRSNWNLEMLIFVEGGKRMNPEKNSRSKDENQQQNQTTYDAELVRESNSGHTGGRQVLSPLRHPCSPKLNSRT